MPFWSIARKDLRILFRDRSALVFIFGLPLIFTGVFGTVYGKQGDASGSAPLKILVANQDAGPHGAELIDAMQKVGLGVEPEQDGPEALAKHVKSGDWPIGVVVPPDYSARLEQAMKAGLEGRTETPAALRVLIDPAQTQIAGIAQGALNGAIQRSIGTLIRRLQLERVPEPYRALAAQSAQSMDNSMNRIPVRLDVANAERRAMPSAGDLMIPGFAVYFVFFMANSVAATLLVERQEGTLRRMLSAPITRGQILFGKLLARGLVGVLQTTILFAIGKVALHLTLGATMLPGIVLIALVSIFTATGLGLLIATFGKTMEQIQGMTTLALLLMGLLSGTMIPRQFLPETMQRLSFITPHAWALNAYQDLLLRHLPLTATLLNIGVLTLFGLGFYGIALARFRYE